MKELKPNARVAALLVLWGSLSAAAPSVRAAETGESLSFAREIQPILARKCYACHGPDEGDRQADLRLDEREAAVEYGAIVPEDSENSSMIERIFSDDPDLRMPPPHAHDQLTEEEKQKLRQWIDAGAKYEAHWAFTPPIRPELPKVENSDWPRNGIDHFVLARLEKAGLSPAAEADRYTLIRRLSLDLTGLPPSPEEVDQFINDQSPDAYENVVDRLLASPRYGEKWARLWLDLARYADTNGYEKDRAREIWPYRDWVIRAINDDMPFDQFTTEQLAGDLLPDPTIDQLVATGFHRNTMLNEEGGIDPLEYRYYAMVDRVATTGTVWMGMTIGCAQCHSHKYDPISHTDYFRFMALLNNADEPDQILPDETVTKKRAELQARIEKLQQGLTEQYQASISPSDNETVEEVYHERFTAWLNDQQQKAIDWTVVEPTAMQTNLPRLEVLEDGSLFSTGDITKRDLFELTFDLSSFNEPITGLRLEVLPDDRLPARGPGRAFYEGRKGDFFLSEVTAKQNDEQQTFNAGSASYGKISIGSGTAEAANVFDNNGSTGWSTSGREGESHQLLLTFTEPVSPDAPLNLEMLFERHFAASLGRFRISFTTDRKPLEAKPYNAETEALLASSIDDLTEADRERVERLFLLQTPELEKMRKQIEQLRNQMPDYPTTMVLRERPEDNPRETHRHHRGEFLNPEEEVSAGIPLLFPQIETSEPSRLALANWLTSEQNPLLSRVVVNRQWQTLFGYGLVRTPSDFGTQSEPPTHPELLDWLAVEFRERGWSRKQLHRLIVTSATYRQTSDVPAEQYQRDPDNRLLARGPRFRISAETIRDTMLHASGLLSDKMFGPGVYPPQPESVVALAYGNEKWPTSTGEDRYRRSLYTFIKRTAPFAAFTTFDGPTGETCTVQRDRSNTPLQALTLLNDEMYLEMARAMASDVTGSVSSPPDVIQEMFRRLVTRPATEAEMQTILAYYERQQAHLKYDPAAVKAVTGKDDSDSTAAAWILTARLLMNLDEAITKF